MVVYIMLSRWFAISAACPWRRAEKHQSWTGFFVSEQYQTLLRYARDSMSMNNRRGQICV